MLLVELELATVTRERRVPNGEPGELTLLERIGSRYLGRLSHGRTLDSSLDAVHVLNPAERAALRRIESGAIVRAALAGALSALVSGLAAVWAVRLLGVDPELAPLERHAGYWAVVGTVTIVASILEIGFLYWDALRSVHALATAAGLDVSAKAGKHEQSYVAVALARAALELPNPPRRSYGVDPLREASKFTLLAISLFYKLKIAATTFIARALFRQALGRAGVRAVLELVAVPVTAIWNAAVCWLVMREARLRAMGPSAALELADLALDRPDKLSEAGRQAALGAIACAIVRTRDLHPNLVALLGVVLDKLGASDADGLDDSQRLVSELPKLADDEQRVVLRLLAIATVIDGRLTSRERTLLREAFDACQRSVDLCAVELLRRAFVSGEAIAPARVQAIAQAAGKNTRNVEQATENGN